ncbi:hypothetical protein Q7P35_010640 [Cladosporium inversicolor]
MANGDGTANMKLLATTQQKENIYISKLPLASKRHQDQSEDPEESHHLPKRHRKISPSTTYVDDTDVMEVTYTQPRHAVQDPIYTAAQLAQALDILTTPQGHHLQEKRSPTLPQAPNPFSLPVSSLPTWHHARITLGNPTYFYTTLLNNLPFPGPGEPRPEPEERFEVRTLEVTMEIEQGLADLRGFLRECQRRGDERALEGLRGRVRGAMEGVVVRMNRGVR